jgi:HK97 family phage prohead protease
METTPDRKMFFTSNARLKLSRQTPTTTQMTTAAVAQPSAEDEPVVTLKGYAIVWNVLSTDRYAPDGSTYKVRLIPGSASFTTPCRALYEHEAPRLIGITSNGSLRLLPADDIGIPFETDLPDTTTGRDVAELVEDEYLSGMSFTMAKGFEDSYTTTENGQKVINATKYTVDEITVCADPAFLDTSVALKDPAAEEQAEADGEFSKSTKVRTSQALKLQRDKLYLYRL